LKEEVVTLTIITTIIAAASFILAVFGATWLNNRMLKNYLDAKFETVTAEFKSVRAEMTAMQSNLMGEIKVLTTRVTSVESALARIDRQLEQIFKPVLPK
jgi:CII-binding regulator of phage lambda lysogenization HflD